MLPQTDVSDPKKTENETQEGKSRRSTPEINEKGGGIDSPNLNASDEHLELDPTVERETWGNKLSYLLTLIGFAVGFGNVWRFPYLLQENGGVVFLIPYTISVFIMGVPIFYLELAVGQRLRKGPIASWHEISPYLGGMGLSTGLVSLLILIYYNTLVAWVISYFLDAFKTNLGYSDCAYAVSIADGGCGINSANTACDMCNRSGSSVYYWHKRVLDISPGIDEIGNFNWWIFMSLVITWTMIYGVLVKGLKIAGKIVYFTALFPYVVFIIFFIRGLLLENMSNGYRVLFTPQWEKLLEPTVWKTAASQIFFSLSIGLGGLVSYASYLKPNNDCHTDVIVVALVNCGTSIFATIVMFPYLGYYGTKVFEQCKIDRQLNLRNAFGFTVDDNVIFADAGPVNYYIFDGSNFSVSLPADFSAEKFPDCTLRKAVEASASGTGFVFIVFAQAIATLPAPQFWALLFFFMLLTLGIDSAFGLMEGTIASIIDLQFKLKKWVVTSIVCGFGLIFALIFCWGWGQYILVFMDDFSANWPLLLIGMMECFGVSWVYGLQRFARDLALMTGKRPGIYWLICWKYISPILVFFIFIFSLIELGQLGTSYRVWSDEKGNLVSKPFPSHVTALGFCLTAFTVIWVPLVAILRYYGINVIKDEASAHFPEEDLKKERNYHESDEIPTDSVTKLILWGNLQKTSDGDQISRERSNPVSPSPSKINNMAT